MSIEVEIVVLIFFFIQSLWNPPDHLRIQRPAFEKSATSLSGDSTGSDFDLGRGLPVPGEKKLTSWVYGYCKRSCVSVLFNG